MSRLQYKIGGMLVLIGVSVLIPLSLYFGIQSNRIARKEEQRHFQQIAEEMALTVDNTLRGKAATAVTLSSTPVLRDLLLASNRAFAQMPEKKRKEHLLQLNQQWMSISDDRNPFIQKRMINSAAKFLKNQQRLLPGEYGEIFLTNRYGAMIATTGKLTTLAHAHKYWWKAAYNKGIGKVFFDDRGFDTSVKGYVLGIVVPIRYREEIIGILKCNVNIQGPLTRMVSEYERVHSGKLRIVRTGGLIVAEKGKAPLSSRIGEKIRPLLSRAPRGSVILTTGEGEEISSYSVIPVTIGNKEFGFGGKASSIDQLMGNLGESWHIVITQNMDYAKGTSYRIKSIILTAAATIFLLTVVISLLPARKVAKPLEMVTDVTHSIGEGKLDTRVPILSRDEVGFLAETINKMADNLERTMTTRDILQEEIERRKITESRLEKSNQELEGYRKHLEQRVREELERHRSQEEMLVQQSKMAAMGEILGTIAHQWRQPLNGIAMEAQLIQDVLEYEAGDKNRLLDIQKKILNLTFFMNKTMEDFRNFFKPSRIESPFQPCEVNNEVHSLIESRFKQNQIKFRIHDHTHFTVSGYPNEYKQVILILFNNAIDAIAEKGITEGQIQVFVENDETTGTIRILDNGGGIPDHLLPERLFEPFISTKGDEGTGIGLHICKTIIESHMGGRITVRNAEGGAEFTITLPLLKETETNTE